jgi:GntR family transcriptional repressor for pyruvate dehydrogenase complex
MLAFLAATLHDVIEMHVESSIERNFAAAAIGGAVRSQERLVGLIEAGDADGAERHWRAQVRDTVQSGLDEVGRTALLDRFD